MRSNATLTSLRSTAAKPPVDSAMCRKLSIDAECSFSSVGSEKSSCGMEPSARGAFGEA
jgi:hypothetical protein